MPIWHSDPDVTLEKEGGISHGAETQRKTQRNAHTEKLLACPLRAPRVHASC